MKTIIALCLSLPLFAVASPFEPAERAELAVWSGLTPPAAPLVVEKLIPAASNAVEGVTEHVRKWTFPAAFARRGRVVCTLDATDPAETNAVYAAFVDGNRNGRFDVGELHGATAPGGPLSLELTRVNSSIVRIDLARAMEIQAKYAGSLNRTNDHYAANRQCYLEEAANATDRTCSFDPSVGLAEPLWIGTNCTADLDRHVRVVVLRTLINNTSKDGVEPPHTHYWDNGDIILDRRFSLDEHPVLTEADLGSVDGSDLDWEGAVRVWGGADKFWGDITSVAYRIVTFDGTTANLDLNNNLGVCFVNKFESGMVQSKAGDLSVETVYGRPTFSWTHANKIGKLYPAFQLQVLDGATVVYDSGIRKSPARTADGRFRWTAPTNAVGSTWRVSMYDAKFTDPNWATAEITTDGEE